MPENEHCASYPPVQRDATKQPCESNAALFDALARLLEAEELVEVLGGFRGRVRPTQRKASAEIDRARAELDHNSKALS